MTEETSKKSTGRVREEIRPDLLEISLDENKLHIPKEVEEKFKLAGYKLRWIRYRLGEKEDYGNISQRMRHGWRFVTPDEVPEMSIGTETRNFGRYNGLVTVEDVALAKCHVSHVKEVEKLLAQKARRQMQAEEERLSRHGIDRTHKSKVTKGQRRPSFDDGDGES